MKRPNAPATVERAVGFQTAALIIFAVALSVRLLHVWQMRDTLFFSVLMGDSRGYDAWARRLAAGDWIGTEVFYQAPLYPYFLGGVYALFGRDLLAVRLIQAVLGSAAAVALGFAGSRIISPVAGLLAGLMLALYPPAIFFDGLVQKSILDVLFICASLAIIGSIISSGGETRAWLLLGATLGALSLTRENALALAVVVIVWAAVRAPEEPASSARSATPPLRGRTAEPLQARSAEPANSRTLSRRRIGPAAAVVAGLAVVLLPIAVRNYAVGGGFYLTTSQFGSNLYIGNNPNADGSYVSLRAGRGSPEFERVDATELAEQATGRSLSPAEVSSYWTGRTMAYIREQPIDWLRLLIRKTRLLVSRSEMIDTESQESHADYSLALRVIDPIWNFGILLPLALAGGWMLWPQRRRLWPIYAMTAVYAISVVLFFVVARYRQPLVPFLMLFAAAVAHAPALAETRSRGRLAPIGAAILGLMLISFWPAASAAERRAITENNLGAALQEDGRPAEAEERYRRALVFDADYAPALNNLGTALRATGRVDEAVKVYGQAIALDADGASAHYNLGNALMAQGKPAEAAAEFQRALAVNPRFVDAVNNLGMALEAQGRIDDAIDAFRRATQLDPRASLAFANLGKALASRGSLREAAGALEQSIHLDPASPATRYDLGSVLLEAGAFAPAAAALREAVRLDPKNAPAHNNLGIALASQGLLAEAVSHWKEALRLQPDFADARANLQKAGQ